MLSMWLRRASPWLIAAQLALLLLEPAGAPVNLAAIAALAVAAVVVWSLLRPPSNSPYGVGRGVPVPTHLVGPMRSSNPDAPGRPRPRAPSL
jgi:uncharacterized protein (DUF58 family)